jgi:K+-transporting ATPase ATPase A chain
VLLMWQGTPQNFAPYTSVTTVEGIHQTLVNGPMASQTIIEQLGANGGGFVAANVASPNLNPTAVTDMLQFVAMFLLGAGLTNMFGRLVGNVRHGWLLYSVMLALFVAGFGMIWNSEHGGNPLVHQLGISGPNMEGKEVRFGDVSSALSVAVATDTSSGAANIAYDSLMPVSVLTAMLNMQVGEIIFGGTGSGLYGMILLVMLTIFIAGLMIGRTPQYLGKKIGRCEITLVVIATLIPPLAILVPAAIALAPGLSAVGNPGPRALAEVLYTFTSVQANNGSVLGGLTIQTDFYNTLTALVMLVGRFGTLIVVLAIAGGLALQPRNDRPIGSLSASTPFFGALLIATALIVTALTFLPGDALGPIAEALVLHRHGTF